MTLTKEQRTEAVEAAYAKIAPASHLMAMKSPPKSSRLRAMAEQTENELRERAQQMVAKDAGEIKAPAKSKVAKGKAKTAVSGVAKVATAGDAQGKPAKTKGKASKLEADLKAKKTAAKKIGKGKAPTKIEGVDSDKPAPEPRVPQQLYKSNVAPTVECANEFQDAFDYFNKALFGNALEHAMVTWFDDKKGRGIFIPRSFARERGTADVHFIGINPMVHHGRSDRETLSTLVHEMAHLQIECEGKSPKKVYHCKNWNAAMVAVGLTPVICNAKGMPLPEKKTGKFATHEIVKGDAFDLACDELLSTGFKLHWSKLPEQVVERIKGRKNKKHLVEYCCPDCETKVKGKRGLSIICKAHKKELECMDKDDTPEDDEGDAD